MDIRIITSKGGVYIVREATAFGMDAFMGYTDRDSTLRIFPFCDSDIVERID